MTRGIRGAITVGENSEQSIREASQRLLVELLRRNRIERRRIQSILFSLTGDLDRLNPAAAARELGFSSVPLFCVQEAAIVGALPRVIRVLVTCRLPGWRRPVAVYLEEARSLRPDLEEGRRP